MSSTLARVPRHADRWPDVRGIGDMVLPGMTRRQLLTTVAGVTVLGVAACSSESEPAPAPTPRPTTLYAVGDSLTEGNSPNFANREFGDRSWVAHLDPRLSVLGGWAKGGARTPDMVAGVTRSDAETLVMLAGANDTTSLPFETTAQNLATIVDKVGIARVVVSKLPPRDDQPDLNVRFNQSLEQLARDKGWHLIDPMADVRDGIRFKAGMTSDGIHPTPAGATAIGQAMSTQILGLP